ncbi:MAG: class I SAM-dependent methyltransferase, partial [Elusimicrobia bacterium]|nr:class I SAM-dependent methyltransferase [Elusimicrobiota bacterium]
GAALAIGIDISDESVRNANADAKALGLDNVVFVQADAENTCLPDSSVDVILCSGMLHHLDLSYAFPELRRILKPGGRILAGEALNCNPFIKLYRKLTKSMRTEWEANHILGLADLDFAARFFDIREVRFWHVVGYLGAHLPLFKGIFDSLDRFVLERIPLVNRMAWIFTFEMRSLK